VLVYGALAHGQLTGAMSPDQNFEPSDCRASSAEFRGDDFRRNLELVDRLSQFARERGYTVSQLAIAWTLANSAVDVTIVGARSQKHIEESLGAVNVRLGDDDLAEIDDILRGAVQLVGPSPEM
jgi:aryl-alcohol dehydrogenase-like predicted oxidoreductase